MSDPVLESLTSVVENDSAAAERFGFIRDLNCRKSTQHKNTLNSVHIPAAFCNACKWNIFGRTRHKS